MPRVWCLVFSTHGVVLANTLSFLRGRCTGVYRVGNAHQDGRRQAVQRCPASPTRRHSSTSQSRGRISAASQPAAGYLPGVIVPRTSFIGGWISAFLSGRVGQPAGRPNCLFSFQSRARQTPSHSRKQPRCINSALTLSSCHSPVIRNPQDPVQTRVYFHFIRAVAGAAVTAAAGAAAAEKIRLLAADAAKSPDTARLSLKSARPSDPVASPRFRAKGEGIRRD